MDLRENLQKTLGSAYTLDSELGGGGMSRVFVATETRFRRPVVVKVLTPDMAAGVSAERFEREIQMAASLQQANIVPLLSAGETDGIPYYTMPFVAGESLRAVLAARARMPIADCVSILRDVARALSYAHAHGIVHRDIKPDNVLLSHGAAVVTDFGIAKAISAARTEAGNATLTQAGMSVGTPAYMAPEQAAGDHEIDHRVDLYALGCVAFELLTGRPPFIETSASRLLAAHVTQPAPSVRELRADTPRPLADLVMKCLEKRADSRPASADEVLRVLDGINVSSASNPRVLGISNSHLRIVAIAAVVVAVIGGGYVALRERLGAAAPKDKSIAVLPLANLSGDPANDYFGEGLGEEITSALAKAGLKVIGRGSARGLVAKGVDAQAIAHQLGVATVLQGTVQRVGNRVRIGVSLMSASDGSVMWTEKYDREIADIFAVQDEIARTVARALNATLAGGSATKLVRNETADPEAHSLFLQGMYLWNRRTAPAIHQAIGLFDDAARRDPNYARAHAGTALAYVALTFYDDANTDSLLTLGRAAAKRALAADSTLTEAWTATAMADAMQWKNASADSGFLRAIAADSTFATARFWRGLSRMHTRQFAEARRELVRAAELEPTSFVIQNGKGQLALNEGKYKESDAILTKTLALDSTYVLARYSRSVAYTQDGRFQEAIAELQSLLIVPGVRPMELRSALAEAYARAGRKDDARRAIAEVDRTSHGHPPGTLASALMVLGDHDRAISVLRAALDSHDPWLLNFNQSRRYQELRADPVGGSLLARSETH